MTEHEDSDLSAEYASSVAGLEKLGTLVVNLISSSLTAANISYHSVDFRVKQAESAFRKIRHKSDRYQGVQSLTDLLGVRIITYFEDEVDAVAELIEREFEIDYDNSVDKRSKLDPDRFGYLSLHYILRFLANRSTLVEYSQFADLRFELQIRTVLQHAWAEIEHDLGYKTTKALPAHMRRRFSRVAGLLEVADAEFRALRDEAQAYDKEVQENIRTAPHELRVDQATLTEFVRTNEFVAALDSRFTAFVGFDRPAPLEERTIARIALVCQSLSIDSIGDLMTLLMDHQERVIQFGEAWDSVLREEKPGRIWAQPTQGCSLVFLASLIIAAYPPDLRLRFAEELGVADTSKWSARVRRAYELMDGQGDD